MHYINPTGCTLLVQNGVNLGTLAAEEVESWAAPIRLDAGDTVEIPANSDATIEFECEWPDDINVLSVGAHMHDMGANFSVDLVHTDGVVESVYEIEEWIQSIGGTSAADAQLSRWWNRGRSWRFLPDQPQLVQHNRRRHQVS